MKHWEVRVLVLVFVLAFTCGSLGGLGVPALLAFGAAWALSSSESRNGRH